MPILEGRRGSALVAVVTIVDEEYAAVRKAGQFNEMVPGTSWLYRNKLSENGYDVVLAKSLDRSNTPCARLVADLAEGLRPEFILLSGIAGGVSGRDGVGLGDVVIADHVENYEIQKLVDGKDMQRRVALDHPSSYLRETIVQRVRFSGKWKAQVGIKRPPIKKPKKADRDEPQTEPKLIEGNLIAGEKVLGDKDNSYQKLILNTFDKALAVDMESYGLARGVYSARSTRHYNLNYLIIRGISDLVNAADNDAARIEWRDYAAATAAAFTMAAVDEIVACCPEA